MKESYGLALNDKTLRFLVKCIDIAQKTESISPDKEEMDLIRRIGKKADNSRNYTVCDSLMLDDSKALTIPVVQQYNNNSIVEHEASAGKVSEEALYYLMSRGMDEEDALNCIVNGFCKDIFQKLPLEFAAEANKLLSVTLEGAVG